MNTKSYKCEIYMNAIKYMTQGEMYMKLNRTLSMILAASIAAAGFSVVGIPNYVMAASTTMQGEVNEIPGTIREVKDYDESFLSVTGFASLGVKDRSEYIGTAYYREVTNEREFLQALADAQTGEVKVIEVQNDLNLGWNELNLSSEERKQFNFISKYGAPSYGFTNPSLEASGASKLNISNTDGLTIFSKNASTIRHTELKLQASSKDLVIRNLNFDEMWQWDDTGAHKEVGWTFIKVNGANDVWIDHCTFAMGADGMLDMENGAAGVTLSWCEFGLEADENPSSDSPIYKSITYMEQKYQNGDLGEGSRYWNLRENGATMNEIMAYAAYHSKCHLTGSGDKDYKNYTYSDGREVLDGNQRLQLTMAYCHYMNVGQRVPMIRQGKGHLYNCYIDDSTHQAVHNSKEAFMTYGKYTLSRAINARNGASIAADTCVFNGINEPLVGNELQGNDTAYMNAPWDTLFAAAYNRSLIVNSMVTNEYGTYTGGSWDNNGENLFTTGFDWHDKSTIGDWAWSSSIVGVEDMHKSTPPSEPFEFTYNTEEVLPYEYNVVPLEDVVCVVTDYAGAGKIDLDESGWLSTVYGEENGKPEETPDESLDLVEIDMTTHFNVGIDQIYEITAKEATDLSQVTLRYYFQKDDSLPMNFWCDYAGLQLNEAPWHMDMTYDVTGEIGEEDGRYYIEIKPNTSFTLTPGQGKAFIQIRVANEDWSEMTNFQEGTLEVIYN